MVEDVGLRSRSRFGGDTKVRARRNVTRRRRATFSEA
jgi:hypothetical protein